MARLSHMPGRFASADGRFGDGDGDVNGDVNVNVNVNGNGNGNGNANGNEGRRLRWAIPWAPGRHTA